MRGAFVLLLLLYAGSSWASDLEALKDAAIRYVAAMRVVLEKQENLECSKIIEEAERRFLMRSVGSMKQIVGKRTKLVVNTSFDVLHRVPETTNCALCLKRKLKCLGKRQLPFVD